MLVCVKFSLVLLERALLCTVHFERKRIPRTEALASGQLWGHFGGDSQGKINTVLNFGRSYYAGVVMHSVALSLQVTKF